MIQRGHVMAFNIEIDEQGIPWSDYGEYYGLSIGRQRSVLAVAERGLYYWNTFLSELLYSSLNR